MELDLTKEILLLNYLPSANLPIHLGFRFEFDDTLSRILSSHKIVGFNSYNKI